ncbi:trans-sulfuration enzyme family protein [Candidatus Galacturonibacter soehngenii]|uniref:PLP-dependent transferase n=1 Tax=Candidatus Galacturonatibacter soehngenii TaxID=2307010 RepID=A0A7V7QIU2_9FIRM|nr:PLP-dependent aspartate aminotransferase family protein [Candidatus Galacturonibacter soehngenii]KAB1436044.1 PLP-dependent transferase [Candidatus Galacturonibacter soehngenii]MBA4686218.1 PLP-dependent transferase [Candidatus Galacturonibacter soehngenii]
MGKSIDTVCIHGKDVRRFVDNTGSISFPIYQTAAYAHPAVGESTGFDYTRLQNPTREEVERIVADLEDGIDALAFSSGMAAITTLFELFKPGDHIIVTDDLYGGTIRLLDHVNKKNGLQITYVDTSDLEQITSNIKENTVAIYIETPTNPMMKVTDIEKVAKEAHEKDIILIVDNTFLSPYYQKPLLLGADVVIHSGTKYLSGHNDTIAGFLVTSREDLSEKLRFLIKTTGAGLSPFDSWLLLRGIKTLALRMDKHQANAIEIANFLQEHKKVEQVYYIGLPKHPSYDIIKKQCTGFGGMISFTVDSEETAKNVLQKVKLIQFAESLGGVESLITYPIYQTHADVPIEKRLAQGIDERLLRISVGIENAKDLIADLAQALEG